MAARPPFHLAIPVHDLEAARAFYGGLLGCAEGRSAALWVDFNLYGHQLVAHLSATATPPQERSPVDGEQVPVPHFGVVLGRDAFEQLVQRLRGAGTEFLLPPTLRHEGKPGEQITLFLCDPSGNALEFKCMRRAEELFAAGPV